MKRIEEKYYLCLQLREEILLRCYLVGAFNHLSLYYLFLMYQYYMGDPPCPDSIRILE